jgi:mono/diheme cytochrome c family protein
MRLALALLAGFALSQTWPGIARAEGVERGRYLVENVGMCSDCHTPRGPKGELITDKSLRGAPIGFTPKAPMPWGTYAPAIAGLPANWTEAQTATFLQTGHRPDGSAPRPPMPAYRLSEDDARAVAAYLKSLK